MAVLMFLLAYIALMVISSVMFTLSQRGMCRWTARDGLLRTWMKQLLNSITGWILGVVLMFTMEDPCAQSKDTVEGQ